MDDIKLWEKLWAAYVNALTIVDRREADFVLADKDNPTSWNRHQRRLLAFADGKAKAAARRLYDFDRERGFSPSLSY